MKKLILSMVLAVFLCFPSFAMAERAYVTNFNAHTVAVLDTDTNIITNVINVGSQPIDAAVTPDGNYVLVSHWGSGDVYVIETSNEEVIKIIPVGSTLVGIRILPDGSKAYITDWRRGTVGVINIATLELIATIATGSFADNLCISPDGTRVYSTNFNSNTVSVIDTSIDRVINEFGSNRPTGAATSSDGKKIYIANTWSSRVSVYDAGTFSLLKEIFVGGRPEMLTSSTDGHYVYVPNRNSASLSIIDTTTDTVAATLPVGSGPIKAADTSDSRYVYVANSGSHTVTVISIDDKEVVDTISGFYSPFGLAITDVADEMHATVDLKPETLNLESYGRWITCYIELPDGHDVADIDISTISMEGALPAEVHPVEINDYDHDGTFDLMVKFDRRDVIDYMKYSDIGDNSVVELTIEGELSDGSSFIGSDTIGVIAKGSPE